MSIEDGFRIGGKKMTFEARSPCDNCGEESYEVDCWCWEDTRREGEKGATGLGAALYRSRCCGDTICMAFRTADAQAFAKLHERRN